eukprot:g6656.t1
MSFAMNSRPRPPRCMFGAKSNHLVGAAAVPSAALRSVDRTSSVLRGLPFERGSGGDDPGPRRRRVRARGGSALCMMARTPGQQLRNAKPPPVSAGGVGIGAAAPARAPALENPREMIAAIYACEGGGEWLEAMEIVENSRKAGVKPTPTVYTALIRVLLRWGRPENAADVLDTAIADDKGRRIAGQVGLDVMKQLIAAKSHQRVLDVYRLLRVRGYIGRGNQTRARVTTMATCYGARAAESLIAYKDVTDMYRLYLTDKEASGGGEGWEGLGRSLPCVVFRTLYKAKRYEQALEYVDDALASENFRNTILINMAINCLGKMKRWEQAVKVFERMSTDLGHAPDSMTHSLVINSLALSGRSEEAIALFDRMCHSSDPNIKANPSALTSSLNSAINACNIAGRWQDALDLVRRAEESGVKPDMISYSTLMNALCHSGECARALEVFREMIKRKLEPGLVSCNYVLTYCSKHKAGMVAMEFLVVMKKAKLKVTSVSYNAVIAALFREEQYELVLEMFREMQLFGLAPDGFAVSHCLQACDLTEKYDAAAGVIRGLWKMGTPVEDRIYTVAFSVLARGCHVKLITDLLHDMETRGVKPNEGCYTSIVTAYCKAERVKEAERLLRRLRAEGKPIYTAAFTSVISSCKHGGDSERALALFEEMQAAPPEANIAPNQFTYNALISVLTFSGRLDVATEKFREMKEIGLQYDLVTFVNMILGFARENRYKDVLVMFEGMEALMAANTRDGKDGSVPMLVRNQIGYRNCYHEALKGCEVEGNWEMARRILKSMHLQNMEVDVVAYGAAIGACGRKGRWKEALEILREMKATDDVSPNVICYSAAITACEKGGEWRKALHLLLKMINSGVEPDTIAYNASISASANCGEWQMALKLFDSLFKAGLTPDARTYSAVMIACFKGHQWQKAMELFLRMVGEGKLPNKQTINILMELLDEAGQFSKAVYIYEAIFARQQAENWDPSDGDAVNLHGYSQAVAKAAVRSGLSRVLQRFLVAEKDPSVVRQFTIITGRGKHSRQAFEPVLRPVAQDMLLEEFDPPMPTHFDPTNDGRLQVRKEDILAWCMQESEKGKRAPAPADSAGSLKLRGVVDLKAAYDKAVSEAASEAASEPTWEEAGEEDDSWSEVGWTRNANESEMHHVVESIEKSGCHVDVFAYAMLEDDIDLLIGQEDQAGFVPNSCPGSSHYYGGSETSSFYGGGSDASHGDGAGSGDYSRDRGQVGIELQETSRTRAYWRWYGSLAAYRMAVQQEVEENESSDDDGGFAYDWIVSTRFDVAWLRPLPPLPAFSREAVWVGTHVWPISDDFALVPRAFADRYFSAVSAFYSCDGHSWPPPEPWWQPDCSGGGGFQESVLFRHLHVNNVAYRPYTMFDYYTNGGGSGGGDGDVDGGERGDESGCKVRTAADHDTVCVILEAGGLLPSEYSSRDCNDALSEYADLRCRTVKGPHFRGRDTPETFLGSEDPTAWEATLLGAPRTHQASTMAWEEGEGGEEWTNVRGGGHRGELEMDVRHKLDRIRSKLVSLRDAVWNGSKALQMRFEPTEGLDLEDFELSEFHPSQERPRNVEESEPGETCYAWTFHSQDNCGIDEYPGRAPHVIRFYSTEPSLMKEIALATICLAHRLSGGDRSAGGANDFKICSGSRPLELVMVDVMFHSNEVQAMDVRHPRNGAVYWEGPVNVSIEVTLAGPGIQDLDLRHVHACADTERSWPIEDRSRFCVSLEELLEWMISERKLPPEMAFSVDRMRELQSFFPDDSSEGFVSKPRILSDWWPRIGPFFQKGLLLPMPAPDKVVSTSPLHTWEYDEIPWMQALNPDVDWHAVEEAYLGNQPVPITHVDGFFSPKALAMLLDLARGNNIFVENRINYVGAYPSEGMSHPILYQIAEEAAERLPRILGRDTTGWPLTQTWFYMYGGNDGEKCSEGIKVHADAANVNVNVWLAPDSANLGSAQAGEGGGLTVFHAQPPERPVSL